MMGYDKNQRVYILTVEALRDVFGNDSPAITNRIDIHLKGLDREQYKGLVAQVLDHQVDASAFGKETRDLAIIAGLVHVLNAYGDKSSETKRYIEKHEDVLGCGIDKVIVAIRKGVNNGTVKNHR